MGKIQPGSRIEGLYPTFKEWKLPSEFSFINGKGGVYILPLRNENIAFSYPIDCSWYVFISYL